MERARVSLGSTGSETSPLLSSYGTHIPRIDGPSIHPSHLSLVSERTERFHSHKTLPTSPETRPSLVSKCTFRLCRARFRTSGNSFASITDSFQLMVLVLLFVAFPTWHEATYTAWTGTRQNLSRSADRCVVARRHGDCLIFYLLTCSLIDVDGHRDVQLDIYDYTNGAYGDSGMSVHYLTLFSLKFCDVALCPNSVVQRSIKRQRNYSCGGVE